MQLESQSSISKWAREVFGEPTNGFNDTARDVLFLRARQEFNELDHAIWHKGTDKEVIAEIADVFIVLYQVAELMGYDMDKAVTEKMKVNRSRKWVKDGNGTGQHIKE